MAFFFYEREAKVNKVDEAGKPIPLYVDAPKADGTFEKIPTGKFEQKTVIMTDSFCLDCVIRTHMIDQDKVLVLLDDGHEVTEKTPQLKNPAKSPQTPGNIIEVKERVWVQSEIIIEGKDQIIQLFTALKNVN